MTTQKQEEHASVAVPDVLLERFRLNELPRAEADRLDAVIRGDAILQQRLGAIEASDEEIRRHYPPDWLATAIRARTAQPAIGTRGPTGIFPMSRPWAVPAALALATALLLMVRTPSWVPWASGGGPGLAGTEAGATSTGTEAGATNEGATSGGAASGAGGDRIKGGALRLFRRTDTGSETLADGDRAWAGDLIRIGYRAPDLEYGTIVSIDGRGAVTRHLPPSGARAVRLEHGKTVLLDRAYELDDAPLWERFYFITGQDSFEVAPVIEAARRAASAGGAAPSLLLLPPGLEQSTFALQKETKP